MVNQITPIYFTKNNEIRPHKRSEHRKNIGKSTVRARCISSPSPRLVPSRLVYPYLMKIHLMIDSIPSSPQLRDACLSTLPANTALNSCNWKVKMAMIGHRHRHAECFVHLESQNELWKHSYLHFLFGIEVTDKTFRRQNRHTHTHTLHYIIFE